MGPFCTSLPIAYLSRFAAMSPPAKSSLSQLLRDSQSSLLELIFVVARSAIYHLGRQGHGFQRAFVISALEYLAESDAEGATDRPTLLLAIEEPKLYQHPPRARHFFKTLSTIAQSPSVQICYATHSTYFVSPERFDSLRFFRRRTGADGTRDTTVTAASLDVLAGQLEESEANARRTVLARTLSEQFREAFFAKSVLLTEGASDAPVFKTAAEMLELGSLAADGVVVTNVGGKGSQPIALSILNALGIRLRVRWRRERLRWRGVRNLSAGKARSHLSDCLEPKNSPSTRCFSS